MMQSRKTKDKLELRVSSLGLEYRKGVDGAPDQPQIVGYAAVFDSPTDLGWFTETVARHAFDDTVEEDDVRALVDHDSSRILGRTSADTLALKIDKRGLHMTITPPDTSVGRDIVESVARGDIDGASFSFNVLDDEWSTRDGKDYRELQRVKLFDVGPVTFPAYEETTVSTRSFDRWKKETEDTQQVRLRELIRRQRLIELNDQWR